MSRTESAMVALGTIAPAFELEDAVSGRTLSRDALFGGLHDALFGGLPDAAEDADSAAMPDGRKKRGLLVMFVCVHCPYVKHVEEELGRIGRDYFGANGEGPVAVAAIQSNDLGEYPQDGPDGMREQAARCGWTFPYLLDASQEVARSYGAACTPDFFLFDGSLRLAYRGQLDGSRPRRGESGNDQPVTGEDLRRALDAVVAGARPDEVQRGSIGCNIKWRAAVSGGGEALTDPVLEQLKAGVRRFRSEVFPEREHVYREAASSPQRPHTLFITCADSRIDPNEITGAGTGEIFVTRNVGNMVPAYGEMLGGVSAVIEFAVSALHVRHIAVCGHSDCGAMKALIDPGALAGMPTVASWLNNAHAALSVARTLTERQATGDNLLPTLTEQNVLLQMQHLRTHPSVAGAMAKGSLTLSGWIYEIGSGEIRIAAGVEGKFAPVEVV